MIFSYYYFLFSLLLIIRRNFIQPNNVLVLAQTQEYEERKLKQLHVITRHGSRYPLIKNSINLFELTSGILTSYGELQLYNLGIWLKDAYYDTFFTSTYQSSNVYIESSSYDRTIVSANALITGLLNETDRDPNNENEIPSIRPNIPIYTISKENDIYIHGYDKCITYHNQLENLYKSNEWITMEKSAISLLTKLGQLSIFDEYKDENGIIRLKDIYNIYDTIMVTTTECEHGQDNTACQELAYIGGDATEVITDQDWKDIQILAHNTELLKYNKQNAGSMVSGNLLSRIVNRMANNDNNNNKFYLYSGHYPTILGIFAALQEDPPVDDVIPPYGTALLFELYDDDTVELWYKSGNKDYKEKFHLSGSILCNNNKINNNECLLSKLIGSTNTLLTTKQWCQTCNNTNVDVCMMHKLQEEEEKSLTSSSSSNNKSTTSVNVIIGTLFIGLLIGTIIGMILSWWFITTTSKRRRKHNTNRHNGTTNDDNNQHENVIINKHENNTINTFKEDDELDLNEIAAVTAALA